MCSAGHQRADACGEVLRLGLPLFATNRLRRVDHRLEQQCLINVSTHQLVAIGSWSFVTHVELVIIVALA
jgi:hypothetical protein